MSKSFSRRSFVLASAGWASLTVNGCGGGGGTEDPSPSPSPSNPPTPGSGIGGYVWYERSGELFKVLNGTGQPQRVNALTADGKNSIRAFRVSATSTRYLQMGNYGDGSQSGCMILYFDSETHSQRGFVDVNGYVVDARVSPSGNYIAMVRSPDYINTLNQADTENIAGLAVVDISDPSNPRAVRSSFDRDGAAAIQFSWYG